MITIYVIDSKSQIITALKIEPQKQFYKHSLYFVKIISFTLIYTNYRPNDLLVLETSATAKKNHSHIVGKC